MKGICFLFLFSLIGSFAYSQQPCGYGWREVDIKEIEQAEGLYYYSCKEDSSLSKELFSGEAFVYRKDNVITQMYSFSEGHLREKKWFNVQRGKESVLVKHEYFPYTAKHFIDSVYKVRIYDRKGHLKSDESYHQGKKTGRWKFIGALRREVGTYVNDQKEGVWYECFRNNVQYKLYEEGVLVKQNLDDHTLKSFYPSLAGVSDSIEGVHFYPDGSCQKIVYEYHDVVTDSIVNANMFWGSWTFEKKNGFVSIRGAGTSWHNDMPLYLELKDRGIRVREERFWESNYLLREGKVYVVSNFLTIEY
ncbi:MAG: hypothetical protein Crog4KO_05220 [Crocinitomicaceae bacterium]